MWGDNTPFELRVYVSEDEEFTDFYNKEALLWRERGLKYNWDEANNREKEVEVEITPALLGNRTLYAHVYFTRGVGTLPDPRR